LIWSDNQLWSLFQEVYVNGLSSAKRKVKKKENNFDSIGWWLPNRFYPKKTCIHSIFIIFWLISNLFFSFANILRKKRNKGLIKKVSLATTLFTNNVILFFFKKHFCLIITSKTFIKQFISWLKLEP